ncbi:MAG: hypothetical protein ACREXN_03645 [Polaromonas sp.]
MRVLLGVLSLLMVVAVIGVLAKKQLATTTSQLPALQTPAIDAAAAVPTGTVKEQSLQVQQQYKQAVESALQQTRPQPDDK